MQFGERDTLLRQGKSTIAQDDRYVKAVYGEKEVGGTSWLYLSDVAFAKLGFTTDVGTTALPTYTHNFLKYVPGFAVAWGLVLTGLYYYTKRRAKMTNEKLVTKDNSPVTKKETADSKETGDEKDES